MSAAGKPSVPHFAGLKVFDASQGVAGPHCGMLLAQNGAEVIKAEPPAGDWCRGVGRQYGDFTAYFVSFNRGKRSIAIDFKSPGGRALAQKMARQADVVLENNRPGVMARLGLDYDTVRSDNPDVVYCSVTGFGTEGPNRDLPATDSVLQSYSGLMWLNRGDDGTPRWVDLLMIDIMTGLYAFQGVSAALYARAVRGGGEHVVVSLADSIAAFLAPKMVEYHLEGEKVQKTAVPVGAFETKDGRYITVNARREAHFPALCALAGHPEVAEDPRFATGAARYENEGECMAMVRAWMKQRTMAEWLVGLKQADILHAPIHDFGDYFRDAHVVETKALSWLPHAGMGAVPVPRLPGHPRAAEDDPRACSPGHGQHGREILGEFGYDAAAIRDLVAAGAVKLPSEEVPAAE